MDLKFKICFFLLCLTFAESRDCTLREFVNGNLFAPGFDTSDLQLSYSDGDQVKVECALGFNGFFRMNCNNGIWETRSQKCEAVKCYLGLSRSSGTSFDTTKTVISPGEQVTVQCADNYFISNPRIMSANISCQENGAWSLEPQCQEVYCRNPHDNLVRIPWVFRESMKMGQTVTYSCKRGYKKADDVTFAKCTRDGWTPKPLCIALAGCGTPPEVANGDTVDSIKHTFKNNEGVRYECQLLHILEGDPYKTCIDGEWIGEMRCLKPCTVTRTIMDRHNIDFKFMDREKVYLKHNDGIRFRCKSGTPSGTVAMRQTCNDGHMELPTCRE